MDVKKSREEGGVHYPSDGLFSMRIYKHLAPWIDAQIKVYEDLTNSMVTDILK
jgi:hypothetical protein